ADVVADSDRSDLLYQEATHILEIHQLRKQLAYRLGAGLGGQQLGLRPSVDQHICCYRVAFRVVAVQQSLWRPAVDIRSQFPAEIKGVLNAEIKTLPTERRVDVRRIAGQEYPVYPVSLGLPRGIS